jgi:hypothetical protein
MLDPQDIIARQRLSGDSGEEKKSTSAKSLNSKLNSSRSDSDTSTCRHLAENYQLKAKLMLARNEIKLLRRKYAMAQDVNAEHSRDLEEFSRSTKSIIQDLTIKFMKERASM